MRQSFARRRSFGSSLRVESSRVCMPALLSQPKREREATTDCNQGTCSLIGLAPSDREDHRSAPVACCKSAGEREEPGRGREDQEDQGLSHDPAPHHAQVERRSRAGALTSNGWTGGGAASETGGVAARLLRSSLARATVAAVVVAAAAAAATDSQAAHRHNDTHTHSHSQVLAPSLSSSSPVAAIARRTPCRREASIAPPPMTSSASCRRWLSC